MQDFYLIVNWLAVIALLGLGLVALLKSRKLALNKVFALFSVSISIWILASYISNDVANSPDVSVVGNYFVFLFSYFSGYLLLWFAIALTNDKKIARRLRKFSVPILLVGATTCTPLVVAGVKRQGAVYAVEFGPLAILYFISLVVLLGIALTVLRKNIKITSGHQKAHLVVLYRSMIIALPFLLVTEFILPAVTGWFGLTNIGILVMAIPVVALYYSVVKLKLFDLRLVVIRTLGYLFALVVLSAIYGFLLFGALQFVFGQHYSVRTQALLSSTVGIAALGFPFLKRFFDKTTNKIFYQDAYDPQELFDRLNRTLVSSLELEFLLKNASKVIAESLKSEYCLFGLKNDDPRQYRLVGTATPTYRLEDIEKVRRLTPQMHQSVIAAEYLDEKHDDVKMLMAKNNIAVLVRLVPDVRKTEEGLGYIVLGAKKSGNPYTNQDFRVLDTIANELIIAIQNALHFEEIQNFNITLQRRVDEATRQLRRTNAKLEALDETKDDFISMASHQLRTPLTSIKGYVSMVLEGDAGKLSGLQRKMLGQAFISSQRMVFLIADLLNVSRLKTGKFVIEPVACSLPDLISDEISQLRETAASRRLQILYDKPKDFPKLMLDETKTRQVIMNFIDNAIYYTPDGGQIRIELVDKPSTVELRVIDNGIGVPKSEQHHLFTKFYRAANARRTRPDGTGLGLFMAKKVVAAQGGAILFESKEGVGSTFGFIFSKSKLQAKNS